MLDRERLLKKWSRRADVEVTIIEGDEVLRFGKGGGRGERPAISPGAVPYKVPFWVSKRIAVQKARLLEEARLRGYGQKR